MTIDDILVAIGNDKLTLRPRHEAFGHFHTFEYQCELSAANRLRHVFVANVEAVSLGEWVRHGRALIRHCEELSEIRRRTAIVDSLLYLPRLRHITDVPNVPYIKVV